MLWPVLLVVIGHVVVGIAPLWILVHRGGHPGALATLVALAGASLAAMGLELRQRRRPGAVCSILVATWAASAATAVFAARHGLF